MRRRLIEFVVLLAVAIGAGPVGASIWQWSTTAGNNDSADPSINWREGMAPSAVNDSARAMMAGIAAWRNDISGVNATGGTSTAYTLTTSEGVASPPANGQMIAFIVTVTNGASPTLAVDGGTAYPIWLNGSPVGAASLIGGSPYRVAFSLANSAWLLEAGPSNPYNVALGGIMWSTVPTAPNSAFIAPYGQCISTTTYSAYWVAMGSPASGSCPGGQFAVIDMRGRFAAALDTLPGSTAANRMTNSANGCGTAFNTVGTVCANGLESWVLTVAQLASHTHANSLSDPGHTHSLNANSFNASSSTGGGGFSIPTPGVGTISSATTGITINNASAGSGNGHPSVPPVIGLIPYLRVL